jgi:hypothetical protein
MVMAAMCILAARITLRLFTGASILTTVVIAYLSNRQIRGSAMSPVFDSEYVIVLQDVSGKVIAVKGVYVDQQEAEESPENKTDDDVHATIWPLDPLEA